MRLCVLTASVSRNAGGFFVSVRRLTQSIYNAGVHCRIHAFKDEHTHEDVGAWMPLEVITYSRKGLSIFPVSGTMRQAVTDSRPDIVHCHGLWLFPSLVDLSIKRSLNTPYVISPRGMMDPWALKNSAWKKKIIGYIFENRHLRNATCIHALCQSEANSIRAYGLKNPIAVLPNGIDLPDQQEFALPPWHGVIEHGSKVLLYLGRLHPKKGLPNLLAAWKQVQEKTTGVDWILAIAGWSQGGHEQELKDRATALRLEQNVIFVGSQFGEGKAACYHHADAFVLPSFSEGLPMVILEAWAHGLPVLMTPQCNITEGFAANAALSMTPDVESIVAGLEKLMKMSERERAAMGARGKQLVRGTFSWSTIAAQMIEVYSWVLGEGKQPDCVVVD